MSIYHPLEKINPVRNREGSQRPSVSNEVKQFLKSEKGKDFLVIMVVVLVGLGSFELGRLSKNSNNAGIRIEYADQGANVSQAAFSTEAYANTAGKNFFASSKGSKYYPLGCSAGNNIKQENKIYFNTREDAEGAGYELSSACN